MTRKLYVGNLTFSVTEDQLKNLFTQFGTVDSVKIVKDTFDGRSKGFGFVEMSTDEEATLASENLNGTEFEGRSIRVDLARPKEARPRDNNRGPRPGGDRRSNFRPGGSTERRNRW
jgi:RNA recognition motif-containing protein